MTEQTLSFQAEVSRLLDIVANALYSNKEIFLRELVSNASDACDRLRYAALTQPELAADDPDFKIVLTADKAARTLTIADNGIGMNREELIENLGTIARSGTAAFVQQLEDKDADVTQIGQFGVGFYSAFMVADRVEVASRRAGEAQGWLWRSDGKGAFTVIEDAAGPARGTRITLHLKEDEDDYLEASRLRRIVKTYSDHIAIPIVFAAESKEGEDAADDETLNAASAIWTRSKSEISEEQYKEFYHHVGHTFDEPWMHLHFKAEGRIEYTALLFLPSSKPFDLFHPDRKNRLKLYVKRVFITDDCEDLVPSYLRFLRGVIDTEDLPLNISRELLQRNPMLAKIRGAVVKRVLDALKKKAEAEPEAYRAFWDNFGAVLKEGLYEDEAQREPLLALSRFSSTAGTELVSLDDYVGRMKEGQEAIFYISGDDAQAVTKSPQLEGFAAKGVEVLLLTDPVDDFWISSIGSYADKPFKSVTRGGADLGKIKGADSDTESETKSEDAGAGVDALLAFLRLTLKDTVKDVRASERLTESPVCLVADEGDMDMHLERLLKQHNQLEETAVRVLEINPGHPLIQRLCARIGEDGAASELEDVARLLLDQARIMEGESLPDPAAFARRVAIFVEKGLGSPGNGSRT